MTNSDNMLWIVKTIMTDKTITVDEKIEKAREHMKLAYAVLWDITTAEAHEYHVDTRGVLVGGVLPGIRNIKDGLEELRERHFGIHHVGGVGFVVRASPKRTVRHE